MRPTPLTALLFLAALLTALLPLFLGPRLVSLWLVTVAVLVFLMGLDAILALPRRRLTVDLRVPETVPIGDEAVALVHLHAASTWRRTRIQIQADVHGDVALPERTEAKLGEAGEGRAFLPFQPGRRGTIVLERLWLRWTGPFGLMRRTFRLPLDRKIAVVPNVGAARDAALRLFRHRDSWIGSKAVRHVGEGSAFESLREYVPGLDHGAMNWKASARHRQLITTEFRDERNHQVILVLDTGHLMGEPDIDGVPKLDHATTAALVLATASLRHGDRVGAFTFDQEARAWMEPRGSMRTLSRLQTFFANAAYGTGETNYTLGLAELSSHLNRRSFIVVFTDFVDTVTAELMLDNAARLSKRHLVTFVTFRNPYLAATIGAPPLSMSDVYRAVVADGFQRERELVLHKLRRLGIFCIEAGPSDISAQLLNRYLDVKRRELVG